MMIARLKAIGAAVLVVATLAGLATVPGRVDGPATRAPTLGIAPDRERAIPRRRRRTGRRRPARVRRSSSAAACSGRTASRRRARPCTRSPLARVRMTAEPILRSESRPGRHVPFRSSPRAAFDDATGKTPWSTLTVLASAEGLGPDWVELHDPPRDD